VALHFADLFAEAVLAVTMADFCHVKLTEAGVNPTAFFPNSLTLTALADHGPTSPITHVIFSKIHASQKLGAGQNCGGGFWVKLANFDNLDCIHFNPLCGKLHTYFLSL
jgi:hypothetical protein